MTSKRLSGDNSTEENTRYNHDRDEDRYVLVNKVLVRTQIDCIMHSCRPCSPANPSVNSDSRQSGTSDSVNGNDCPATHLPQTAKTVFVQPEFFEFKRAQSGKPHICLYRCLMGCKTLYNTNGQPKYLSMTSNSLFN